MLEQSLNRVHLFAIVVTHTFVHRVDSLAAFSQRFECLGQLRSHRAHLALKFNLSPLQIQVCFTALFVANLASFGVKGATSRLLLLTQRVLHVLKVLLEGHDAGLELLLALFEALVALFDFLDLLFLKRQLHFQQLYFSLLVD